MLLVCSGFLRGLFEVSSSGREADSNKPRRNLEQNQKNSILIPEGNGLVMHGFVSVSICVRSKIYGKQGCHLGMKLRWLMIGERLTNRIKNKTEGGNCAPFRTWVIDYRPTIPAPADFMVFYQQIRTFALLNLGRLAFSKLSFFLSY